MNVILFCHSLRSDWNHGHAHFLRGIVSELQARGHGVRVFEPRASWSATNLAQDHGETALDAYRAAYPRLPPPEFYDPDTLDLDQAFATADLVIVHEWTDPALVARIGAHRAQAHAHGRRYRLLFHDTHHRAVTRPHEIAAVALEAYDGVLAFGEAIRAQYLVRRWASRVWTWHEAADTRVFHPRAPRSGPDGDVTWVGNWGDEGDEERRRELQTYLLDPLRELNLRTNVYGVRYPAAALDALSAAGCRYRGWTANFHVPDVFARHRVTVHVPREIYVRHLPGVPTIRPFEAMACGIPLICAPWSDAEGLFTPNVDYLVARSGTEMRRHLRDVLHDASLARGLATHGRATILRRHTCAHRVDELLNIYRALVVSSRAA